MSSLRLALKLSLQENPDAASTEKQVDPFDSLNTIGGRKRKGSLDKKESRKKSRDESSSSSKPKYRSGDEQNRDGSSVAGDSFTSIGLNADEASVSSHALHKDDDTHDDNDEVDDDATAASLSAMTSDILQSQQNIFDSDNLKIKEEKVSVPSVKSEKNIDKLESVSESMITANENVAETQLATISEDKQDEVASPRKTGGKKKRLLKGLDVSEKDVAEASMEGDEDGPRYQSHRAAAMVAKTKLNVTTTISTGKQEVAETAVSTTNSTLTVAKEPSRRGGWNRGTGRAAAVRALQQQQQQLEQEQVPIEWVLCDKCGKWRSLSPTIDIQSLPEVWQCSDNSWDLQHNHCEAPEQSEEEAKRMYSAGEEMKSIPPSLDPPRTKREASDATSGGSVSLGMAETPMRDIGDEADNETGGVMTSGRGGRAGGVRGRGGRGGRRGSGGVAGIAPTGNAAGSDNSDDDDNGVGNNGVSGRPSRRQVNYAEDDEDAGGGGGKASGQRRRGGLSSRNSGRDLNPSFAAAAAAAAVNWVQCNKCKKWRKVPETIDVSKLPETWLCHMNTWNPSVARCTAREEVDEPVVDTSVVAGAGGGVTPGRSSGRAGGGSGVGRYGGGGGAANNQQVQAVIASMIAANAAAIAAAANAPPLPPGVIRQIKWVQCERKNCKKWRKVPAYIDMETFPEKWYCEMNFWSPERASCEVVEDHDSDEERKKKEARSNRNLLLGNNKGGAQLSYRRIIYGTDAKVRPHFAEKIKLGNGIFTYPIASRKINDDDDDENVFHYNEGLEPVRRVPYWWSTSYDDRLHGLHPNCAPATFIPATTVGAIASFTEVATETWKKSTSATDFLTLSSSSVANDVKKSNDSEASLSYLMDTARRLYREATNTTPLGWTTQGNDIKVVESIEQINSLTLYQRMNVEMNVVRTLLHSTNDVHVLFIRLMDLMATCQFLSPVFEACRYLLVDQKSALVDIVHRLEEKGEVEVGYTRDNQLVITLLPSLDTLRKELASRRTVFNNKINSSAKERHFNPRLRKCFRQSNPSATNNITVDILPYSESTLRAVATTMNQPVRTNDDGSLLLQFPNSGPNKILHSSETLASNDATVIPPLTSEEMMMIAAAANAVGGMHGNGNVVSNNNHNCSNGNSKVYMSTSNNIPSVEHLLQQQQLQQQQLMMMGAGTMGGRGKRGGRGRGRGRGGAVAMGSEGGMERAMGGRGAAKRAPRASADTAAAALAAGLNVPEHLLASSIGAGVPMDGVDTGKKTRKPYTKRKTSSLDESIVPAGMTSSTVSAAVPTANVMNKDANATIKMDTAVSSTSETAQASFSTNSTYATADALDTSVSKKDSEIAEKMVEDEEAEEEEGEEVEEDEVSESGSEEDGDEEADEEDDDDSNEEEEMASVDKEKIDDMEENGDVKEKQMHSGDDEEQEENSSAGEEDEEEETFEGQERSNESAMATDNNNVQSREPEEEKQDMTMQEMLQSVGKVEVKTDDITNENTAVIQIEKDIEDDIGSIEDAMTTDATKVDLDTTPSDKHNYAPENVDPVDNNNDANNVDELPSTSSAMDVDE